MNLPKKPYHNIYEVAKRWTEKFSQPTSYSDIVSYIESGVLPALINYGSIPSERRAVDRTDCFICEKKVVRIFFRSPDHPSLDFDFENIPFDQVFILTSELIKHESQKLEDSLLDGLPEELRVAVAVYYEFWHDRPDNMNPATKKDIALFISEKIGRNVGLAESIFKRINTMARTEKDRKLGTPKTEFRYYKGKSKLNL
ncbi:MAG: hypothetical protein JRG71_11175 [Deltaproteobacteria bacterium]|nr:hypothetical protein [Deltaproteobacteria bacterium]